MPEQTIDYGSFVERALRGVLRDALGTVAEHGLPGRHQIYLTFRTDHPGVVLDDSLRARYPGEMTIVLQHEFWDLEVGDEGFAVTLSFNEVPQRLEIPFAAVSVFADPSVEFGLQFKVASTAEDKDEEQPAGTDAPVALAEAPHAASHEPVPDGGAEVVTLDRFRKK